MPPLFVRPSWYQDYWLTEPPPRSLIAALWIGSKTSARQSGVWLASWAELARCHAKQRT
jgi:hypothetical protein